MVEPTAQVVLALPVRIALDDAGCLEETRWLNFCCSLLTTRLIRVLRFQSGKVPPMWSHPRRVACASFTHIRRTCVCG